MPEFGKEKFVIYSEPVLIEVTPIWGDCGIKYESVGDQGSTLDVCCGDSSGGWY